MTTILQRPTCLALWLVACLTITMLIACGGEEPAQYESSAGDSLTVTVPTLSEKAQAGQALFNANCMLCHGPNASGTGLGPPLVHKIYEPSHHQDFAFRSAAQNGVQSHHWQFGNMPPVPGVSDDDVERIICYVRELQHANGIFDEPAGLAAC